MLFSPEKSVFARLTNIVNYDILYFRYINHVRY